MRVICPHCQRGYKVDQKHAGKRVRCAKCQGVFFAPVPVAAVADPDPASMLMASSADKYFPDGGSQSRGYPVKMLILGLALIFCGAVVYIAGGIAVERMSGDAILNPVDAVMEAASDPHRRMMRNPFLEAHAKAKKAARVATITTVIALALAAMGAAVLVAAGVKAHVTESG